MLNKADATRLRVLVAIKSRALTLVSASGASVVDILLMARIRSGRIYVLYAFGLRTSLTTQEYNRHRRRPSPVVKLADSSDVLSLDPISIL